MARLLGLVEWSVPVGVDFLGPAVRGKSEARQEIGVVPPDGRRCSYRVRVGCGVRSRCILGVLVQR